MTNFIKTPLISLLLCASTFSLWAQGFVDNVKNTGTSENTYRYNYTESKTMDGPIYFFFEYTSLKNDGFEGQLTHNGTTVTMFHKDDTLPANRYVSEPLTTFNGMNSKGNWDFHVHFPEGTTITKWGVFSIPEPSVASLLGLGLVAIVISKTERRKKI